MTRLDVSLVSACGGDGGPSLDLSINICSVGADDRSRVSADTEPSRRMSFAGRRHIVDTFNLAKSFVYHSIGGACFVASSHSPESLSKISCLPFAIARLESTN